MTPYFRLLTFGALDETHTFQTYEKLMNFVVYLRFGLRKPACNQIRP